MNNTISYTIVGSTGEEFFSDIPVNTALENIKKLMNENSKWLFIDQNQETSDTLTADKLIKGQIIVLTDMLGGG
jgi:hypothetical protein